MNSPKIQKTATGAKLILPSGEIEVDFVNDKKHYWRNLSGELLAKAVGTKKGFTDVVDATAGLARDAFVLARLGCRVRALEKNQQIFSLLNTALEQAKTELEKINLEFVHTDATDWLARCKDRPQVVYLDPMFENASKKSLPKKEIQLLRSLEDPDLESSVALLTAAISCATERVAVKRSLKAPLLLENCVGQIKGTTVRYDIYQGKGV